MRKGKNLSKSVATHLDLAVYLGFLTVLYLAPLKGISSPISPAPTMGLEQGDKDRAFFIGGTRLKSNNSSLRLYPTEEAAQDNSFAKFKPELRRAVRRRDATFLLKVIDPNITLSFGGDSGLKDFKRLWHPERKNSRLWKELEVILSLGGTFDSTSEGKKYCAPYVTSKWKNIVARFPEYGNAYQYAVILRRNVKVHAKRSANSPVLAMLSFDVIKVSQSGAESGGSQGGKWVRIITRSGGHGYVNANDIRSPLDYSACFKKVGGRWMMVSFIAGD